MQVFSCPVYVEKVTGEHFFARHLAWVKLFKWLILSSPRSLQLYSAINMGILQIGIISRKLVSSFKERSFVLVHQGSVYAA